MNVRPAQPWELNGNPARGIRPRGAGLKGMSAFTLMELVVVVALIGILTAMILPEMKGTYEDALLRSTARDLMSAMELARSRAVSFQQPHRLRIETGTGDYAVEKRVRRRDGEFFIPLRGLPGASGKLDSRVAVETRDPNGTPTTEPGMASVAPAGDDGSAEPGFVRYFPDGTADARELLLRDRQGFQLTLRINPTTARVRVLNPPAAPDPGGSR